MILPHEADERFGGGALFAITSGKPTSQIERKALAAPNVQSGKESRAQQIAVYKKLGLWPIGFPPSH